LARPLSVAVLPAAVDELAAWVPATHPNETGATRLVDVGCGMESALDSAGAATGADVMDAWSAEFPRPGAASNFDLNAGTGTAPAVGA